ncbi:hypothetical protein AB0E20_17935, partial [Streptomyces sp. NPDC047966]
TAASHPGEEPDDGLRLSGVSGHDAYHYPLKLISAAPPPGNPPRPPVPPDGTRRRRAPGPSPSAARPRRWPPSGPGRPGSRSSAP